ncbi:ABC transporter family protein [Tripterygium wilfordii]|uniref:ABC transporter family protein n=1 Tax=Tripterygium wilfordii TaxID=458696 RepID=A0A7J7DNX3_TRIWF|nr:ABC transporter family protein [Tripterygium wilfordii]
MSLQTLLPPSSPHLHRKLERKSSRFFTSPNLRILSPPQPRPLNSTKLSSNPKATQFFNSHTLNALSDIKPYLLSQHRSIIFGWLCSFVSVLSISQIVSRIGKFSSIVATAGDAVKLRDEGLVLGALFLVRLISSYLQQAVLWDAALNVMYEIRVYVFQRVLERELGFFEGGSGVSPGDIAYRITAEAADVADTIYALLNNIVPSTLQLSAVVTQMLLISPTLSLISGMVIPCMAFATAYLGERQRKVSKKAHLSIANLSAYLNEVFPAILFIKASNAELRESVRFQKLANADLYEHLKKKKMKALTPHIIQITYFGALCVLCVGSLVVSRGSFDLCSMVSFLTSLVFLIEPIQGFGKAYNEVKQGEPGIERLFDLTRFKSKVTEEPDAIDLDFVIGEVKFCDVSFRYGDNRPLVFNGLSLHVKAGETVALVGPSGGGKTTLVKLLLRLYDPLCGCILVDNHNIQNVQLESLRRHIALVSQDIEQLLKTLGIRI